ncbi:MAG: SWIM zinc finger family protein [Bacteroidota bacterium]
MSESITYQYARPSQLRQAGGNEQLFLSQYSEIAKPEASCFFWGRLNEAFITARCLLTLSKIVQSSFNLSPFQLAMLKDPIVTAGNKTLRFEGFSHCAGVYGRVDVLAAAQDGEFPAAGTTNVDFNAPMLNALARIRPKQSVVLSVGEKEVSLEQEGQKVIERKVPLPTKWIKGLTTVQIFLAQTEPFFRFNRVQAQQLFRSLPKGNPKQDYYLSQRGSRPLFSPMKQAKAVCVGGVHRLRLLEPLLPLAQSLEVYAQPEMQATTWVLSFGAVRFTMSLSRETWRGFSGEGAALESLVADVPQTWIERLDQYSYANQTFNPTLLAIDENLNEAQLSQLTGRLAAMGLLGFDLHDNAYFYRRLPFKLDRILRLNPRMKNAEKLVAEGKVEIVARSAAKIEARVAGTDVKHTVIIEAERARCTCTWFSRHQGERGPCKHILAVKKLLNG